MAIAATSYTVTASTTNAVAGLCTVVTLPTGCRSVTLQTTTSLVRVVWDPDGTITDGDDLIAATTYIEIAAASLMTFDITREECGNPPRIVLFSSANSAPVRIKPHSRGA